MKFPWAAALVVCFMAVANPAHADKDNNFSVMMALGEAFGPSDYRISIGSFDLGVGVARGLYLGSRLWKDGFYAGFGPCLNQAPGWYGILGYEWRFVSFAGLNYEVHGSTHTDGTTGAYSQIGVVVGW